MDKAYRGQDQCSMDFSLHILSIIFFFLLHQPLPSSASLHKSKHFLRSYFPRHHPKTPQNPPLTKYFEVTKPIKTPRSKPCSYLILRHDFGYTFGKSPILAHYTPPSSCSSQKFAKIVLEWKATCKGKQFDRIFGVWLAGAELLRSCTAEPRKTGTIWTVQKDITRFQSLLIKNQTLAVYLGNIIDQNYTGVYHVNISLHFYPVNEQVRVSDSENPADLILPLSRDLPLKSGLWFEIRNSTDIAEKELQIPQNVYRAVLEVYVSFHEDDEFWYTNPPNEYIAMNNVSDLPGNGAFREVVVSLDNLTVGAIWPFTVVYTGGINPLLWRPITSIGSFDLPTYNIEITPLLGNLLDGKPHLFGFGVTNALNVWYIDANLHVWLDRKSLRTEGKLLQHNSPPSLVSSVMRFKGLDGAFLTGVSRNLSAIGWVKTSFGKITTSWAQSFNFTNTMKFMNNGSVQIVRQAIEFNDSICTEIPSSSSISSFESFKRFPFYLYYDTFDQVNDTINSTANVTLEFNEEKIERTNGSEWWSSSLKILQKGQGYIHGKGNSMTDRLGHTQEVYDYESPGLCYFRSVSSSNYSILRDEVLNSCSETWQPTFGGP